MSDKMKALSIRQPWAMWVVLGAKDIENRTWGTKYRGDLLIHAGKQADKESIHESIVILAELGLEGYQVADFTRGAIVGMVSLVGIVSNSGSPWANEGLLHWQLDDARMLAHPIPCRGRQGIFDVPAAVLRDAVWLE